MKKNFMIKSGATLEKKIFDLKSEGEFEKLAVEIFHFQYQNNNIYKKYVDYAGFNVEKIRNTRQIPFLPIEFYKNHRIIIDRLKEQTIFYSSGTTGLNQSKHYVANKGLYRASFVNAFNLFYGKISNYCILALLPGYLERQGSSLIYMVKHLMQESKHPDCGFYLNEFEQLNKKIQELRKSGQKYIIIGVTYALLDFASVYKQDLAHGIILETGGMKGKRKELLKKEVHELLKSNFNLRQIHSEYGMTELLSQAYSKGDGIFLNPPWMKIYIRDTYDPYTFIDDEKSGGINVIDLANLYSCSFIETKDLGKKYANGSFEVLGRFDNSDIRGCNLLVE